MDAIFKGYDEWRISAPDYDDANEYDEAAERLRETQRRMMDLVEELVALAENHGDRALGALKVAIVGLRHAYLIGHILLTEAGILARSFQTIPNGFI